MMHVAGPKFKSVFSFCFFSALRRGWVRRHLALGLVQNRRVVRSRVFAASAALGTWVGPSPAQGHEYWLEYPILHSSECRYHTYLDSVWRVQRFWSSVRLFFFVAYGVSASCPVKQLFLPLEATFRPLKFARKQMTNSAGTPSRRLPCWT
jgi:hypothetical protein